VNFGRTVQPSNQQALSMIVEVKAGSTFVSPQLAQAISQLWADPAIQHVWENRNVLQLPDSAKFFLDKVERIAEPEYLPDDKDLLAVRIRSTGIVQYRFTLKEINFHIFDVGGQRTERRKWVHLFQDVKVVVFVAGISEYDQLMWEADDVNRMTETLSLFDEIMHSMWFINSSYVLFLNKIDLFKEKIARKPLSTVYNDYKGAQTFDDQVEYVRQQFLKKNTENRPLFTHLTCAIDDINVRAALNFVADVVTEKHRASIKPA